MDEAGEHDDGGGGQHDGLGEVEEHGDRGAVPLEKFVTDEAGGDRTNHGSESHEVHGDEHGKRFGPPVDSELLGEEHDGQLVRAMSHRAGRGVGHGVEPDERMGKDGGERFFEGDGRAGGVVEFIFDRIGITGGGGFLFDCEEHEEGCGHRDEGWDDEKDTPFAGGDDPGADGPKRDREAGEEERCEGVDRKLTQLDHDAEDTGEGAAFGAAEPRGIDFDHAGCAVGLEPAVEQRDESEGGERADEGREAEDEVTDDGADGADEHGPLSADAVGEEAVDQLAGAVSE